MLLLMFCLRVINKETKNRRGEITKRTIMLYSAIHAFLVTTNKMSDFLTKCTNKLKNDPKLTKSNDYFEFINFSALKLREEKNNIKA